MSKIVQNAQDLEAIDSLNGNVTINNDLDVNNFLLGGLNTRPVLQVWRSGMSGSTTVTASTTWTNVGNSVTFTPKKAGSLLLVMHGVQIWYSSTSVGSGDMYFKFLFNGVAVHENTRMMGNFDGGNWTRFHNYGTNQFTYETTSTAPITIQTQAYLSGSVPSGLNFYHTSDASNQIIIVEYA